MGLDISVYSKVKLVEPQPECEDTPDDMTHLVVNPDFPERADGIASGYYEFEKDDGFAAGSYSGYNKWREILAILAGYPAIQYKSSWETVPHMSHSAACWERASGPFYELIHFADNEGVIGPVTAKKLAADFAEYQAKVDQLSDDLFKRKYADWRRAFELASDSGAVAFY